MNVELKLITLFTLFTMLHKGYIGKVRSGVAKGAKLSSWSLLQYNYCWEAVSFI